MADITIVNLNMLYVRYFDTVERERHLPLGPLYVTAALEEARLEVDFRDYQQHDAEELFSQEELLRFLADPAPVVGFSCMANLLPFTLLAMRRFAEEYPDRTLVLGGVGTKSVEEQILAQFPWVQVIVRGEAETSAPLLVAALRDGKELATVPGISYRDAGDGTIRHTPRPPRLTDLDAITPPAYEHVDLRAYDGFGMVTSRGCPYSCTFCSVAPVWDCQSYQRSCPSVVDEMARLQAEAGAELILFQDEFFLSHKRRVMEFCDELARRKLDLKWKAFGRVNLVDETLMTAMAETGCVELRFGIESGSDRILKRTKKGFTAAQSEAVVSLACDLFPRVDCFFVWGYPFETMEDFNQSLFQMVSFRMMGARILPSLLCLLPQTEIFREEVRPDMLEFAPDLFPEYMVTGHEVSSRAHVEVRPEHQAFFDFIAEHPDIFPGFFHVGLEGNIRPKLRILQELGFYPATAEELADLATHGT